MLAEHFNEPANTAMHKADRFEREVKKDFIENPEKMKLLIVVDKLLTGFDAPLRDLSLYRQKYAGSRAFPSDL